MPELHTELFLRTEWYRYQALMRHRVCVPEHLIEATSHHEISEITYRELLQSNLPCWRGQCSPLAVKRLENSFFHIIAKKQCSSILRSDQPFLLPRLSDNELSQLRPLTSPDVVRTHGHRLPPAPPVRTVPDPSNLRTLQSFSRSDVPD